MTGKEEKHLSLSYAYALASKRSTEGSFHRVKELIKHFLTQNNYPSDEKYIVPLLCQQYSSLRFYISFLEEKLEDENILIDEKTGLKRLIVMPQDVAVLTALNTSIDICEKELSLLNVSYDLH